MLFADKVPTMLNPLPWSEIETVLLDMDGTILDLRFDNQFWRDLLPARYAERHGLPLAVADAELKARTQAVEGTIQWYCLDYWSRELALDIVLLKREIAHLIKVHPHVVNFLEAARAVGKRLILVTNAHRQSLALKMEQTQMTDYFDVIICAHDFGYVKEQQAFWSCLRAAQPFVPETTLLVDDNVTILRAAQQYGIAHLIAVSRPDSASPPKPPSEFPAIDHFAELLPI